jgi:hypothetical protein
MRRHDNGAEFSKADAAAQAKTGMKRMKDEYGEREA